jgi:hypothetical protein
MGDAAIFGSVKTGKYVERKHIQSVFDMNQRMGKPSESKTSKSTTPSFSPGEFGVVFRLDWVERALSNSSMSQRSFESLFGWESSSRPRALYEYERSCWNVGSEVEPWRRVRRMGEDGGKNVGRKIDRNSSSASVGRPDLQRRRIKLSGDSQEY